MARHGKNKQVIISTKAGKVRLEDVISDYLRRYGSANKHTSRAKELDLSAFCGWLKNELREEPQLLHVTNSSVKRWLGHRLELESPSTVSRRLKNLKHLCRIYDKAFRDFDNPCLNIKGPIPTHQPPACLSREEKEKMREVANKILHKFRRARTQLILELGFLAGLRCSEMIWLTPKNLSKELKFFIALRGKGAKYDTLPIHSKLREVIISYLEEREKELSSYDIDGNILPLLVSTYGASIERPASFKIDAKTIWRIVKGVGTEAGVIGSRPHRLRHTFIKDIQDKYKDLRTSAQLARHRSIQTTMLYASHDKEALAHLLDKL